MEELNSHWDNIFLNTDECSLGWYEDDLTQTLKFFDLIDEKDNANIFISGAGVTKLVDELLSENRHLVLNDISKQALNKIEDRIRQKNSPYTIFHHNLANAFPKDAFPKIDIWIDRAVLHFLTNEEDINTYFQSLNESLNKDGYVLFAEFSNVGATQCAGLDVHRYSLDELTKRVGDNFSLIKSEEYTYTNPNGNLRPYIYALFKKVV